jgi:hypothetical protein
MSLDLYPESASNKVYQRRIASYDVLLIQRPRPRTLGLQSETVGRCVSKIQHGGTNRWIKKMNMNGFAKN